MTYRPVEKKAKLSLPPLSPSILAAESSAESSSDSDSSSSSEDDKEHTPSTLLETNQSQSNTTMAITKPSAQKSSSNSDSSSSSEDDKEPIPSTLLETNQSQSNTTMAITKPSAEGYPSSTSYGECFEILLIGVLDPNESVTGFGNWPQSSDTNLSKSRLLAYAKTPLDKLSVIHRKKSLEGTEPTPKALVPPNSSSTFHYTIPTHILDKLRTSSPMLSLLKSYYTHPSLKKKFSYTWLERAVQAFTLKMVQVQSQYHIESHDIFIGATAMSAKRVINPKFDDVLLTVVGIQNPSYGT